jgi:hypothetical protein
VKGRHYPLLHTYSLLIMPISELLVSHPGPVTGTGSNLQFLQFGLPPYSSTYVWDNCRLGTTVWNVPGSACLSVVKAL